MTDEQKALLTAVANTLDTIPVAGHANQANMYNCVLAIRQIIDGVTPGNEAENGNDSDNS